MKTQKNRLIWFSNNENYYGGDCNCACEMQQQVIVSDTKKISNLKLTEYHFSEIKLDNNHFIIWNNNLSSGINIINAETHAFFKKNANLIENKNIINLLLQRNLISYNDQKVVDSPINVLASWLHISNNCNLDCSYCYINKSSDNMTLETGLQSIKSIFNSAIKNDIKEVKLKYAGAEALFNFSVAQKMQELALKLAKKHNIKLTSILLTNATLLTDKIIEKLKLLQFKVMVSIDGIDKYHDYFRSFKNGKGSYQIVAQNTKKIKKANILSDVSITVTDNNIEGLPELIQLLLTENYPFNINFYRENENIITNDLTLSEKKIIKYMKETFKVIENNLPDRSLLSSLLDRVDLATPHNYTCGIGRNYAVIDTFGQLSKCQMEIGKNKTFATIKSNDLLFDIQSDKTQLQNISVENKSDCQNCEIKNYCTGGCSLISTNNESPYSKSPNCNIYKALYKDVLKLEAKRIMKYTTPHILN